MTSHDSAEALSTKWIGSLKLLFISVQVSHPLVKQGAQTTCDCQKFWYLCHNRQYLFLVACFGLFIASWLLEDTAAHRYSRHIQLCQSGVYLMFRVSPYQINLFAVSVSWSRHVAILCLTDFYIFSYPGVKRGVTYLISKPTFKKNTTWIVAHVYKLLKTYL